MMLAAATLLGIASSPYAQFTAPVPLHNTYLENHLVRITDSNAIGRTEYDDDRQPYRIAAETICNGRRYNIHLYFPAAMPNPGLAAGEEYLVTGSFYRPSPAVEVYSASDTGEWQIVSAAASGQGYLNYLKLHDISGELVLQKIEKVSQTPSAMTRIRQTALSRLDRGIESPQRRAILGAMTLGVRSRLDSALKQKFAASGVAHLFSISGLHIGVLAVLILLVLRPLPTAWHWLISSTLILYVLATGGNAPAIRAFAMVIMLEFFKSRLLRVRTLELLSLIATVLLLYEPLYLCDAGFQYSFAVTAMLIKVSPAAREAELLASGLPGLSGERSRWWSFLCSIRGKFCSASIYAGTAFLVSGALMLYHQHMFFNGSMLLNLLLLPILLPLFATAILKCLLPWGDALWNVLLNWMLGYLEHLVEFFYNFNEPVEWMKPHGFVVLLFIVSLALLIDLRHSRLNIAALFMLMAVTGFQLLQPAASSGRIAVVIAGGDLTHPVAAILQTETHNAYMLNAGRDAVYPFKSVADVYGITHISRLDFGRPVTDCVDGLPALQKNFPIHSYRISDRPIRSKQFKAYTQELPLQRGAKSDFLSVFDSGEADLKITPNASGSWQLQFDDRNFELPRTYRPRIYIVHSRK